MKKRIHLLRLSLKNMERYYYIPLVVLFVFLPICSWLYIRAYGLQESYISVMNIGQMFIPITSTWWVFCGLKEYIEGDGNELFYVYKLNGKTKVVDILLILLWYCCHIGILFGVYAILFNTIITEIACVMIQCFFFSSFLYFLTYALKSTSIAYMFVLIYYFMIAFFSEDTIFEFINIFSFQITMNAELLFEKYLFIGIISGVVLFLGALFNRRYSPK